MAISGKDGYVIYSLGALGFFMSIMFPTIFTLGIAELGKRYENRIMIVGDVRRRGWRISVHDGNGH